MTARFEQMEEATLRELRAVRLSDDGRELLLADEDATPPPGERLEPTHSLQVDDRLRGLVRLRPQQSATSVASSETRPESALSPREIQARLRAGDTAEEVARAAGIPVGRVARYEAPIAAERVRIVDEVRRATAPGPHRVNPGRALGSVVDNRLSEDGLDPALASWVARRRPDSTWIVTVELGNHHAEWSWDGAARRVRAHDAGAQQLLSPSRAASESLIAVAQAAGVTTPTPEPHAPLAPARAVGDTLGPQDSAKSVSTRAAVRSGLVVLPGEGAAAAVAAAAQAPVSTPLDDVPGAGGGSRGLTSDQGAPADRASGSAKTTWTPMGSPSDEPVAPAASADVSEPAASAAADGPVRQPRAGAKSAKRRSAVPAWDDIVFGARRS